MTPADVQAFVEGLQEHGIVYLKNGKAQDLVVVDQQRGPASPCDWVDFGQVNPGSDPNIKVSACRLVGSASQQLITPDGWKFENSLSAKFGFVPNQTKNERLVFVEKCDGVDVYIDMNTGKEVYIGRSSE
jgi:hypothetical protein